MAMGFESSSIGMKSDSPGSSISSGASTGFGNEDIESLFLWILSGAGGSMADDGNGGDPEVELSESVSPISSAGTLSSSLFAYSTRVKSSSRVWHNSSKYLPWSCTPLGFSDRGEALSS